MNSTFFKHNETISGDEQFLQDWIGLRQGASSCFYDGFLFVVVSHQSHGRYLTLRAFDVNVLQSEYNTQRGLI